MTTELNVLSLLQLTVPDISIIQKIKTIHIPKYIKFIH